MKNNWCLYVIIIVFVTFTLYGCASIPKTYSDKVLDDIYPILTNAQIQKLKSLQSKEEVNRFTDEIWKSIDSTYGNGNGEIKKEYEKRLKYANEHFPDQIGWGRSDKKRIYLLYGPPSYVETKEFTNIRIDKFSTIKSYKIWLYMDPAQRISFPSPFDDLYKGERKFIFADMTGSGSYEILYSTEENQDLDTRLLFK